MKSSIRVFFILLWLIPLVAVAEEAVELQKRTDSFKQKHDWLKLTSDEWLKGDIISMYDEELEFDSKKMNLETLDWEDVEELYSKDILSIRVQDGAIYEGYFVLKHGQVSLEKGGETRIFAMNEILSIAPAAEKRLDLWDGYLKLGSNFRRGNTVQLDYTVSGGIQRRSASSRFKTDFTASFSEFEDQETGESTVTTDNQRLTTIYDWFFSSKIFFRAVDLELTKDEFLNLAYRLSYGLGAGYHLVDSKRTSWDINIGPSYQRTEYIEVLAEEDNTEGSFGLDLGTDYTYEISKDIDYDLSYQVSIVSEDSGSALHRFQTGLEIDLTSDFDLDVTLYLDRTENPKADAEGNLPEQNDYRLAVSLGYDF